MSQRESGYARIERDAYETPEWATFALVPYISIPGIIWEPANGSGKMSAALHKKGFTCYTSDIIDGIDFLNASLTHDSINKIITNPPYFSAQAFIEHALELMWPVRGSVAMLLRTDFDHAKSRRHLFADSPAFCRKVILTRRIRWFADSKGSPSFNHAWFIWDYSHIGPAVLSYDFQ